MEPVRSPHSDSHERTLDAGGAASLAEAPARFPSRSAIRLAAVLSAAFVAPLNAGWLGDSSEKYGVEAGRFFLASGSDFGAGKGFAPGSAKGLPAGEFAAVRGGSNSGAGRAGAGESRRAERWMESAGETARNVAVGFIAPGTG
jgi:hypothetical protein